MFATSIGASPVVWDWGIRYPVPTVLGAFGPFTYFANNNFWTGVEAPQRTTGNLGITSGASFPGVAYVQQFDLWKGRFAGHMGCRSIVKYDTWWYPWAAPWLGGSPGNVNPGTLFNSAGELVACLDWSLAFGAANPGPGDGMFLIPFANTGQNSNSEPAGVGPWYGGMGIAGDGAGGLDFFTFDNAGAYLFSYALAPALVPDLTAWFSVRFVFTPASSGGNAGVTVSCCGTEIFSALTGSANLPAVDAYLANAIAYCTHVTMTTNPSDIYFTTRARFGRFLPDGTQIQAE